MKKRKTKSKRKLKKRQPALNQQLLKIINNALVNLTKKKSSSSKKKSSSSKRRSSSSKRRSSSSKRRSSSSKRRSSSSKKIPLIMQEPEPVVSSTKKVLIEEIRRLKKKRKNKINYNLNAQPYKISPKQNKNFSLLREQILKERKQVERQKQKLREKIREKSKKSVKKPEKYKPHKKIEINEHKKNENKSLKKKKPEVIDLTKDSETKRETKDKPVTVKKETGQATLTAYWKKKPNTSKKVSTKPITVKKEIETGQTTLTDYWKRGNTVTRDRLNTINEEFELGDNPYDLQTMMETQDYLNQLT